MTMRNICVINKQKLEAVIKSTYANATKMRHTYRQEGYIWQCSQFWSKFHCSLCDIHQFVNLLYLYSYLLLHLSNSHQVVQLLYSFKLIWFIKR